ncbi:MAG: type II toxin-antitoxin system ParD family antitoxin [Roseiarcus sp.]
MRDGLRLVEEREARLAALDASIERGGEATDEEIEADLANVARDLRSKGVAP